MTSRRLPVTVIRPLPGIMAASMVSNSPPTSVQASPVTMPIWSFALDLAVTELRHAEIIREVFGGRLHRFLLRHDQFLDRLADQGGELALEVAHARLARVAADDGQ